MPTAEMISAALTQKMLPHLKYGLQRLKKLSFADIHKEMVEALLKKYL